MSKSCECQDCNCSPAKTESLLMPIIDNMGREIFWEEKVKND